MATARGGGCRHERRKEPRIRDSRVEQAQIRHEVTRACPSDLYMVYGTQIRLSPASHSNKLLLPGIPGSLAACWKVKSH